ncbi:MAG: ACT domain-containing protein [Solirubrobacterales bacterium]
MAAEQRGPGPRFRVDTLPAVYEICRLEADADVPEWVAAAPQGLLSVTRTESELSIVCTGPIPAGVEHSRGWRAVRVLGTLEHTMTGVLVSLAAPLADAGIPIFAISTFDTDYLLVPGDALDQALAALADAGHTVAPR